MPRFEAIRDRLPSLYRPDEGDSSLYVRLLRTVGESLDAVDQAASDVLQSHWFRYADQALYSAYYLRFRQLAGQPAPNPANAQDREEMEAFPFIHDLAYLAALLPLAPWQEPPALCELLEAYRLRIGRIVEMYTNGLGTPEALRRMVEAQLPVNLAAPPEQQDAPFWLEEFAPLDRQFQRARTRAEPGAIDDVVGPLMRWTVTNSGLKAAAPTVYVQGLEPQKGLIDAAVRPLIELYSVGSPYRKELLSQFTKVLPSPAPGDVEYVRLGITYRDTLGAGQTLRLRPAYTSWLGIKGGALRADSQPSGEAPADPTAPGPWQALLPASIKGSVVALHQAEDCALWLAVANDKSGELRRYDGSAWTVVPLDAAPEPGCLVEEGQALLIGTAQGLWRMPLYPEDDKYQPTPVPALGTGAVSALVRDQAGQWWAGTDSGLLRGTSPADGLQAFGLGLDGDSATAVHAIHEDSSGTIHIGTDLGLFQYQPGTGRWYWYEGKEGTEQAGDWQPYYPDETGNARRFPTGQQVYLPPVRCVRQGPDSSLWLGTDAGIARYVAHAVRGLTYQTVLEAFPDLGTEAVHDIQEDERGLVWFCTDTGLFRFDGRDWWQFQVDQWQPLGRADTLYGNRLRPRGAWRFERASGKWQQLDPDTSRWIDWAEESRAGDQPAVWTVCWTDGVAADLGQWDGTSFSSPAPVSPDLLGMRFKPSEVRIVDGGLPAVPRLPVGSSVWRYLSVEPEDQKTPDDQYLPAWTIEGRLQPGAPASAPVGPTAHVIAQPAQEPAALPGLFGLPMPPPDSQFDQVAFAFNPSARVWFGFQAAQRLSVLARLWAAPADQNVEPVVLDRVWQGMQQVRPAGVRTALAVSNKIVRGGNDDSGG